MVLMRAVWLKRPPADVILKFKGGGHGSMISSSSDHGLKVQDSYQNRPIVALKRGISRTKSRQKLSIKTSSEVAKIMCLRIFNVCKEKQLQK
ncbi:hypothetical protein AVEN_3466-1 [Araneus ventricosus]|uniref:Uncharacterized protein n=1 Tax=Araneus ventricosus TaxID=182803 RepID=A0A4Y2P4F7_ARAVE|nr:hypothetical protein AVEN_136659-1 [Araneus ventricosus]GBN45879.1 hypothetical protein AVEN_3466-1 [Araneus ventricosus]